MPNSKKPHVESKAELQKKVSQLESQLASTSTKSQGHKGRTFLTGLLVFITAFLFCTSITAFWLRQTLFDTNTWVKKTSTIMQNSSVQQDIALKTVDTIFKSVNVDQYVAELLPDKAKPLSGTITSSLQSFSNEQVKKLLATSQFQDFWKKANTQAHIALLKTISTANQKSQASATSEVIYIQRDQVILNVTPVLNNLKDSLASAGLGFVNNLNTSSLNLTMPIVTIQNLPAILLAINTINGLAFWLPIITLIFAGLTIWSSLNKRKSLMYVGIVSGILLIIDIIAINAGGYAFVTNLTSSVPDISSASGQVIYSTITGDLLGYYKAALVLMLLIVLFTYLTGTSVPATWVRNELTSLLKGEAKSPVLQWLGKFATIIIGGMITLTTLLVLFAPFRSAQLVLIVATIVGILSIILLAIRNLVAKGIK